MTPILSSPTTDLAQLTPAYPGITIVFWPSRTQRAAIYIKMFSLKILLWLFCTKICYSCLVIFIMLIAIEWPKGPQKL